MSNLNLFEIEIHKRRLANEQKIKENIEKFQPREKLNAIKLKFEKHLNIISDEDISNIALYVSVIENFILHYSTIGIEIIGIDAYKKMLDYFEQLDEYLKKYDNMRTCR